MAEANQFTWTHKDLVKLFLKEQGIHEGRWWLLMNFGMSPGHFGPSEEQISPGIVVAVTSIGIQRVMPDAPQQPPSSLTVDAAEVNPKPKTESLPPQPPRRRKKS
jgi:hypothetical protein